MIGRLYADGLMQQTEDFRFTVLQRRRSADLRPSTTRSASTTPPRVLELLERPRPGRRARPRRRARQRGRDAVPHRAPPGRGGDQHPAPDPGGGTDGSERRLRRRRRPGQHPDGYPARGYCNIGCKRARRSPMLRRRYLERPARVRRSRPHRPRASSGSARAAPARASCAKLADGRGSHRRGDAPTSSPAGRHRHRQLSPRRRDRGLPVGKGCARATWAAVRRATSTPT